jgi:hypothetical protein
MRRIMLAVAFGLAALTAGSTISVPSVCQAQGCNGMCRTHQDCASGCSCQKGFSPTGVCVPTNTPY